MPAKKVKTDAEKAADRKAAAEKFVELANKRTEKALNAIAQIGQLGAKTYVSEQFQRDAIAKALEAEVGKAVTRLNGTVIATGGFAIPTEAPKAPDATA